MTRKKVKLAYITNDSARKATFKKRKKGLMKKVSELSTLCDIEACAIVYSSYDSQPDFWPSPLGVQRVLAQFRTMPEMEQSKRMVDQESFLRQRISKVQEQLKKQRKDNREKEMIHLMFQILCGKPIPNLSMADVNDLVGWVIDQYRKELHLWMRIIKEKAVKNQREQVHGAQIVPAAIMEQYRMGSMRRVGEDNSINMPMKSDGEGTNNNVPYLTSDQQQMHNVEAMQLQIMQMTAHKQQNTWFTDMINAPPNMEFIKDEMMLHYGDPNQSTMLPNPPHAGGFNFP